MDKKNQQEAQRNPGMWRNETIQKTDQTRNTENSKEKRKIKKALAPLRNPRNLDLSTGRGRGKGKGRGRGTLGNDLRDRVVGIPAHCRAWIDEVELANS